MGPWRRVGLGGRDDDLPRLDAAGRVNGNTVRPLTRRGFSRMRGSPTSGAPTRSSSGTRYVCASGSSSSRLGLRCPVSSRDSVLFDIPASAAASVKGEAALLAHPPQPGPTRSSAAAMRPSAALASLPGCTAACRSCLGLAHEPIQPLVPRNSNNRCR